MVVNVPYAVKEETSGTMCLLIVENVQGVVKFLTKTSITGQRTVTNVLSAGRSGKINTPGQEIVRNALNVVKSVLTCIALKMTSARYADRVHSTMRATDQYIK